MDAEPRSATVTPTGAAHAGGARYAAARRVTVVGGAVNLLLAAAKIVFGVIGNSAALVADGVHSLSDLISDAMVLLAAKHGSRAADAEHPYGHARIETAMTVGVGLLLIAVALGIMWDAARRLLDPALLLHPGLLALAVAVLSVLAKEALYHYTVRVARRIRSNLLRANAWHHRTDAISSVIVVLGVLGVMIGYPWLDAVAAVAVGLMIIKIGWHLAWHSLRELVDTGLDAARLDEIRQVMLDTPGVRALHQLRTRRMGAEALVDVHVLVDGRVSVSEGHQIGETVRARVIDAMEEVSDVTVHVDPEDDASAAPCLDLPERDAVRAALHAAWADVPEARTARRLVLHYLDGRVHVEVILPLDATRDAAHAERIAEALRERAARLPYVGPVEVMFS
ncbi:cation transporter [Ectothiorhodospiraceae bacterium 2226]|nr:cation transporter [Ectothiorhodospiraceae bacterium 2226]